MGSIFSEAGTIFSAILENDAWVLSDAFRSDGAWLVGLITTLMGGALVLFIYRKIPLIDHHLERTVMVWTYLIIAAVIFIEVFRRFILNEQAPWSTTLPPYLFLIMAWFGCSFNIKKRTHLAFNEFRTNLPPKGQIFCLMMDAVLWLVFCWVVIVTSTRVTLNSAANFQILPGTDNVMQWWFLVTLPIAFILMSARVLENLIEDFSKYKANEPLIEQIAIGGD